MFESNKFVVGFTIQQLYWRHLSLFSTAPIIIIIIVVIIIIDVCDD